MPLFEYRCRECDARFEKIVPGSNRDDVECPHCGTEKAERQISTFATNSGGVGGSLAAPRFT